MKGATSTGKRIVIGATAIVQLLFFPVVTFADSPIASGQENTSPATTEKPTGPASPTGAEAGTYTQNKDTGLWENEHYTWDPATKQTAPKAPQAYSYNPDTSKWDTTEYKYDAPSGKYVPHQTSIETEPQNEAATRTAPDTSKTPATSSSANDPKHAFNSFYNADISNNLGSKAISGDSSVTNNTVGANATSGNALAIANVLNMLQSSWGMSPDQIATFMADINGDVVGDLLLDPSRFTPKKLAVSTAQTGDITVNSSTNSSINNNIDIYAGSGDATVSGNTAAGNATSGGAAAIANVINLINSHISAGQSFVGNININGSLEGDILLPDSLQKQLLASNVPTTTIATSSIENGELLADFDTTQTIQTDVDLNARSGAANVANNTNAGSARTGGAETNLTVFNLTGKEVIGNNALLVFVNVLGEWVGMIVNAPSGSTAAMLGNNSTNGDAATIANAGIHDKTTNTINNAIKAHAQSGDANIHSNTRAGNATSGNASASANVTNISNSQFSLADWFGVLFINVLGSWHGSFGVDTAMGDRPILASAVTQPAIKDVKVFALTSDAATGQSKLSPSLANGNYRTLFAATTPQPFMISEASSPENTTSEVLGATSTDDGNSNPPSVTATATNKAGSINLWPAGAAILLASLLLAADRILRKRSVTSRSNRMAITSKQ